MSFKSYSRMLRLTDISLLYDIAIYPKWICGNKTITKYVPNFRIYASEFLGDIIQIRVDAKGNYINTERLTLRAFILVFE